MHRKAYVSLAEALLLVASGGVGQVSGVLALHGDVVLEGDVADLDVIEGPISVQTQCTNNQGIGDGKRGGRRFESSRCVWQAINSPISVGTPSCVRQVGGERKGGSSRERVR